MKPGTVGAVIVLGTGAVLWGLVFAKDKAQVSRARSAYDEGTKELAANHLKEAQAAFERSLEASLVVGAITGRRPQALEIAADARAAVSVSLALQAFAEGDGSGLAIVDGALTVKGARALAPDVLEKASKLERARLGMEVARGVERVAVDIDKRAPEATARAKKEYHELSAKTWTVALGAAEAAKLEDASSCTKGEKRGKCRALVQAAIAVNLEDKGTEASNLAQEALNALKDSADAFDEKELGALTAAARAIYAEGVDRTKVLEFEQGVAKLEGRVPTNDLGSLLPDAEGTKEPTLEGGHRAVAALEARKKTAAAALRKVCEVALEFKDMVLATSGEPRVYVDRFEITNAEYRSFMDVRKPYSEEGRTAETWGSAEWAKQAGEEFLDKGLKDGGPATWLGGAFPSGQEKHPVAGVSAIEATAYTKWRGKRLPTRSEWVGAAGFPRGGESAYPWGDAWKDTGGNVRIRGREGQGTSAVGSFPEGDATTGARDMVGNVKELVSEGEQFLAIGGSHDSKPDAATLRSAYPVAPAARPKDQGFRCAKELKWK
ncbi:SUMF1/EgtB/PvdO family nonheme iron enzyme [bacterium]|nr:SUMF1/EgtB/PvdO family nonheme iron enzyme [bacterium]